MNIKKSPLLLPYLCGIILIVVDFLTKTLANKLLPFQKPVDTFLPFVVLYRTHNTGYHWIFGKIGNHMLWSFAGLVLVVFLIYSMSRTLLREFKFPFNRKFYTVLISLMIGATSNVLEILFLGRATDFFLVHPFPWPSNISDQYINAILYIMLPIIIIKSVIDWRRQKKPKTSENSEIKKPSKSLDASEGK